MKKIISLFCVILISCPFFVCSTYASWAYAFVVYDGDIYIVSDAYVEPQQIGKRIGEVTKYSDKEGTYSGNFSNRFPKGTQYYEIKGVAIKEVIAIKEAEDSYIKAEFDGKYAGSEEVDHKVFIMKNLFVYFGVGIVLLFGIFYFNNKKRNSK